MDIRMTQTRRLSEDAFTTKVFNRGQTYYDVADTAARSAIAKGWAVCVDDVKENVNV